jgi:hypothetical protein
MSQDFQASSSEQGRAFESAVELLLKLHGWTIIGRRQIVHGVEIDIVADDPDGTTWWIECKGSWRGKTPGSRRGDTVKKAVGVAAYLSLQPERCKYMLITSHMPAENTVGWRMLDAACAAGWFDDVRVAALLAGMHPEVFDDIADDDAA